MTRFALWVLVVLMGVVTLVHAADHGVHVQRVVPQGIRDTEGFKAAESAGLFVGIRTFDDQRFAEIPFAVDDAIDLAYLFTLELSLIDPQQVILALSGMPQKPASTMRLRTLLNAGVRQTRATQAEVYTQLAAGGKRTGPRGLFVVALATHGFNDQGDDFLVGADSRWRRIQRTGIAVAEVFDDVARAKAPRRLVFLDACRERLSADTRAGGVDAASAMGRAFADAIAEASGQVVLSATTIGGYAYDDAVRQNGVFTAAVLDGLRGRAPADARHFITAQTLAEYVNQQVHDWVGQPSAPHRGEPGDQPTDRGTSGALALSD